MKEHPILFSAPMVRAILDGSKTQTRRVIKPQPMDSNGEIYNGKLYGPEMYEPAGYDKHGELISMPEIYGIYNEDGEFGIKCPYGKPDDQLWVRETVGIGRASNIAYYFDTLNGRDPKALFDRWTPSIHMPRWASRITLEITNIRVERLNDCSEQDALAEGCEKDCGEGMTVRWFEGCQMTDTAKEAYKYLWESINGAGSWAANPWVWVVEFKVVKP